MTKKSPGAIRCAIYTRKSSEEGLEQEFNSLHAQREACEAYILSQKQEGWSALPDHFDDGGFSGGSMSRPALERLLEGIRSSKIDSVVVYKIDRLTRSLADFAKMVELFDEREVTFVSVTQQFNTTTSMGRLTLNVLLSFAQFEREVTGERIRDKIAASKKKGMWMGGNIPMGYDVKDRKLIVNVKDAATIRHIYHSYLKLGSVRLLQDALEQGGVRSPIRLAASSGLQSGGRPLARGALYKMLSNRVYIGEITHKALSYPGLHAGVIDRELWDQVQRKLAEGRSKKVNGFTCKQSSLLAGLMYDVDGNRMTPSHANKNGRRYRYYISRSLTTGPCTASPSGLRIPAKEIEHLIEARLLEFLVNEAALANAINEQVDDAGKLQHLIFRAKKLSKEWECMPPSENRNILLLLILRIDLSDKSTVIRMSPNQLLKLLLDGPDNCQPASNGSHKEQPLILRVEYDLRRCGLGMRMLIDGRPAGNRREPNDKLVRLIAWAHLVKQRLTEEGLSLAEIARQQGCGRSYLTRLVRLAFLSPDITADILIGKQSPVMIPATLMRDTKIPNDWKEQASFFTAA